MSFSYNLGMVGHKLGLLVGFLLSAAALGNPQFTPKKPLQGGVVLLTMPLSNDITGLTFSRGEKSIPWATCLPKKKKSACALIGLPFDEGVTKLSLTARWTEKGKAEEKSIDIPIRERVTPLTKLKVDPEKVKPSPEDQIRIDQEKQETTEAMSHSPSEWLWSHEFRRPAAGQTTSQYGGRRVFNGELKSVHYGVDLRANEKTAIRAANDGKVVLAKELFYAGNMVILDHGMGVFSTYSHLSKIQVQKGDTVKRGDRLGFAGSTGRVTGPHLHWGMKLQDLSVDPLDFLTIANKLVSKKSLAKK